jgi:hypothetical protein
VALLWKDSSSSNKKKRRRRRRRRRENVPILYKLPAYSAGRKHFFGQFIPAFFRLGNILFLDEAPLYLPPPSMSLFRSH